MCTVRGALFWALAAGLGVMHASASRASAAVIPVVSATGHHQGDSLNGSGSILTAFNGDGITQPDPDDPATWTHNNAWETDWQGFDIGSLTGNVGWMVLDLGAPMANLGSMYVWNVNEGGQTDRGVATFDLYYSDSPTVTPPPVSATATNYDFTSGGWTKLNTTPLGLPQGTGASGMPFSRLFDVSGISSAQYVGLEFISNWGDGDRTGLAEVVFTDVVPPPPPPPPTPIPVPNFSFELPGTGKIANGFGSVPAWNDFAGEAYNDTGVEAAYSPTEGSWRAFFMGSDGGAWQALSTTIEAGKAYTLTVDAANNPGMELSMGFFAGADPTNVVRRTSVPGTGSWGDWQEYSVSFTALAGAPYVGQSLGIFVDNTDGDWMGLDNVRLGSTELSGPIPHYVAVENFSFELPGTGKIANGFGSVPAWNDFAGEAYNDTGVEAAYSPTEGSWRAFFMGSDGGAWQALSTNIEAGKVYTLTVDAANNPGMELTMGFFAGGDPTNVVGRTSVPGTGSWGDWNEYSVSFTALADAPYVDQSLGVFVDNTGDDWMGLDNVRLASTELSGPIPHYVAVENFSFELPGTGKIQNGFGGIPGWNDFPGEAYSDTGVEAAYSPTEGSWRAFFMGSDGGAWQTLGETIESGNAYTLTIDAANNPGMELTMGFFAGGDPANVVAQQSTAGSGSWGDWGEYTVSFLAEEGQPYVGQLLGIFIDNTAGDWMGVDNVRVTRFAPEAAVIPEPSAFALAALGLLGLALLGRRHKRAA